MESKRIKILSIDDNRDSHTIIRALIKDAFPDSMTFAALTGTDGLELASAEDPDVILLDIIMPGIDGFDVCKKLKADDILRDIPVVFLTSLKGDKETRIRALEAGGDAFLAKPIDEVELLAQIRAMVKIKNANIEKRDEKRKLASLVEEQIIEIKKTQTATLNILEDITRENEARKKSEEALREAQILLQASIESPKDMIILSIDKNYQYLCFNTCHKNTMQSAYGKDVKTGMNLLNCITNDDDRRKAKINYDLVFNGVSHVTIEEYGDFERFYYETRYNPIYNDKYEIIGATAFSANITDRIRKELTIKESERRFREMLENVELVAISLDIHGNITFVNDYCLKLTGWKPEEVMGRNWFKLFIPAESLIEKIFFASILNGEMPVHIENEMLTREEKLRLISWNNTMLRDLSGAVIGTSSIGVDITERKEAEDKIFRQLEELQRWQEVTLGREDRNRQLKHEVNDLLVRLGETIRYPSQKNDLTNPSDKTE